MAATPDPEERSTAGPRERRAIRNEIAARRVNERIAQIEARGRIASDGPEPGPSAAFVCECAEPDCRGRVRLDAALMARVHAEPDRFVVCPGHERAEFERVLFEVDGYPVVEKSALRT